MHISSIPVAHPFRSEVEVIAPPYASSIPLSQKTKAEEIPLGGVLFGKGEMTIAVLAEITILVSRWPWAVPCLLMPLTREPLEPYVMLVTELRDRLAVVRRASNAGRDQIAAVVAAVRQRPLPTALGLASWVARRLQHGELLTPLLAQFREAIEGAPASGSTSVSTFSRVFGRYGRYTARDWRALGRLCLRAAATARAAPPSISLRSAWNYTRRYLAVPYGVVVERLGWEWVMERALRTGGYLH